MESAEVENIDLEVEEEMDEKESADVENEESEAAGIEDEKRTLPI